MSVRIRVAAIRQTNAGEIRDAFALGMGEEWSKISFCEHNGWTSCRVSVWGSSSLEMIGVLSELQKPAMLFTSEDGERWYASLLQPGDEWEHLLHNFGNHSGPLDERYWLVDDEDDPDEDEAAEFLDDQPLPRPTTSFENFADQFRESYGCPLPPGLVEECHDLSFHDAILRFQQWHQDRLIQFLTRNGVDCDLDSVKRAISWQGLTDQESESDLGNLPRLLAAVGLGGEWDQYCQDAESARADEQQDDEADDEWFDEDLDGVESDDDEDESVFAKMENMLGDIKPIDVEGGPVELPMKRFRLVEFFVRAACGDQDVATTMSFELPESSAELAGELAKKLDEESEIEAMVLPRGFKLGLEDHLYIERSHLKMAFGKKIAKMVVAPPNDTVFEFAFASPDEPGTQQIYRGKVKDATWSIEATYPGLTAPVLREALELASSAHKLIQEVRDPQEADAVLATLEDASQYQFDSDQMAIVHIPTKSVTGGIQFVEADEEQTIAEALFRLRFRDDWDVTPGERLQREYQELLCEMDEESPPISAEQQAKLDEFEESMARAKKTAVEEARERRAPRIGTPLYQGLATRYWLTDVTAFGAEHAATIAKFEEGMHELAYEKLGDLTCHRFRDFALRCYVHPDHLCISTLTVTKDSVFSMDFFSQFSDGSRLTTTTSEMVENRSQAKLYYKTFPGLSITELSRQHDKLLAKFRDRKKVAPVPFEATLTAAAIALDEVMQRVDEDDRAELEETRDIWRY